MAPSNGVIPALIVVDMQEDFCEPNGSLAVKNGRGVAPTINKLLSYPGWTLKIATRDWHPRDHISFASHHENAKAFTSQHVIKNPEGGEEVQTTLLWPDHCIASTPGAEIIPEIEISKIDFMISKGQDRRLESYSGFGPPFRNPAVGMSELDEKLKAAGVTHVFCVGLAYDFCVKCTAIDAVEFGYRSFIVEDATKAVGNDGQSLEELRGQLKKSGVEVIGLDGEILKGIEGGR